MTNPLIIVDLLQLGHFDLLKLGGAANLSFIMLSSLICFLRASGEVGARRAHSRPLSTFFRVSLTGRAWFVDF